MPSSPSSAATLLNTQILYLRIDQKKYHVLKNILEGYDNLGMISNLDKNSGVVRLRFPAGCGLEIFKLLASLSGSLKIY